MAAITLPTKLDILITGTISEAFNIVPHTNFIKAEIYHTLAGDIEITTLEPSRFFISISLINEAYVPEKGYYVRSTTKTGFELNTDNAEFLDHPTHPFNLDVFTDLMQVAISHTRVFVMIIGSENSIGQLLIPYYKKTKLQQLIASCHYTRLN